MKKNTRKKKMTLSIALSEKLYDDITDVADSMGITKSQLARMVLKQYASNYQSIMKKLISSSDDKLIASTLDVNVDELRKFKEFAKAVSKDKQ